MSYVVPLLGCTINATVAFTACLFVSERGYRTVALTLAGSFTVAAVVAYATVARHEPFGYFLGALVVPWLVWLPVSLSYSAIVRVRHARAPVNKWLYALAVVGACVAAGLASEPAPHYLVRLGVGLAAGALTFPAGLVGLFVATPLIFSGIATPSEAFAIASPVYAVAGYLQWYVVLPRIFRRAKTDA